MALKYVACDPATFMSRVVGLPNDGNDYIIRLDSGFYDFGFTFLQLLHTTGSIHFESRDGATFTNLVSNQGWSFRVACPDTTWVGAKFIGEEYYQPHLPRQCTLGLGSLNDGGVYVCDPTNISFTDFDVQGSALRIILAGSKDGLAYTNIECRRGNMKDNSGNGQILITTDVAVVGDLGNGIYGNIEISEIIADSTNGPDGLFWGGVGASTHSDGPTALDITRLGFNTTCLVENCHLTARIKGSFNHDMHCWRVGQIQSNQVVMTIRDVKSYGYWSEGHATHDGGGNLWLAYHHSGSPGWAIEGSRMTMDIENCLFRSEVSADVAQVPGEDPFGDPPFHLFNVNSSGDYHFYDCVFEWVLPAAWQNAYIRDVSTATTDASVWYHNTTRSGVANDTPEGTNVVVRTNTRTRGWKSLQRRPSYRI